MNLRTQFLVMGAMFVPWTFSTALTAEPHRDSHEDHDDHSDHGEHDDHGHGEGSDLDRSVEDLMAQRCEHEMSAHECEECRYEVGMVRLNDNLMRRGLIRLEKAQSRPFEAPLRLTGEVSFDQRKIAHLGPRVTGSVSAVYVDLGQQVRKGAPLLELESVELAESENDYLRSIAQRGLAEKTYRRTRELFEEGIGSKRDYYQAESDLASQDIELHTARQRLMRLGLSEKEIVALESQGIQGATGRVTLTAPFDGEVMDLHAVLGERIEAGQQAILLGDITRLWVWLDLYESQLRFVSSAPDREPIQAYVTVDAYPNRVFEGSVDYVGGVMEEATRTVKARVRLSNEERLLRPGMFAVADLSAADRAVGVAAPQQAVLSDEGRTFVFVEHEPGLAVRREIAVGRRDGSWVEALSGIEAGQTLVVDGAFLLKSDVLRSKMGAGCAH